MADAPPYWLSALSEELALLADNRDAAGLTAVLKQHALYHGLSERDLTMMIRDEWSRTGIVHAPISGILRGWKD